MRQTATVMMAPILRGLLLISLFLPPLTRAQEDLVDFEKDVYPLLERSCVECHRPPYEDKYGRTKEPKSGLVLTSKKAMEEFMSYEFEKPLITPGQPYESQLYLVLVLPLTDDFHMPPPEDSTTPAEGAWTKEKIGLFKRWIEQGASFGKWSQDESYSEMPKAE